MKQQTTAQQQGKRQHAKRRQEDQMESAARTDHGIGHAGGREKTQKCDHSARRMGALAGTGELSFSYGKDAGQYF